MRLAIFSRLALLSIWVPSGLVLGAGVAVWASIGTWPKMPIGGVLSSFGVDLDSLRHYLPEWAIVEKIITEIGKTPLWSIALALPAVFLYNYLRGLGKIPDLLSVVVLLTVPFGLVVLAWQGYVWATTGTWQAVPIAAALPYWGIDLSAVYEPSGWEGLASAVRWILSLPLWSIALPLPLALLCYASYVAFLDAFILDPLRNFRIDIKSCEALAESGDPVYQNDLGYAFERGALGLPQDFIRAYMWYNVAAATHPPGELRDGSARNRDRLARRMTAEQVAEAQMLARVWLEHPRVDA